MESSIQKTCLQHTVLLEEKKQDKVYGKNRLFGTAFHSHPPMVKKRRVNTRMTA